jgi:hypothetical protein
MRANARHLAGHSPYLETLPSRAKPLKQQLRFARGVPSRQCQTELKSKIFVVRQANQTGGGWLNCLVCGHYRRIASFQIGTPGAFTGANALPSLEFAVCEVTKRVVVRHRHDNFHTYVGASRQA